MWKVIRFLQRIWQIPYVKHPVLGVLLLVALIVGSFLFLNLFTRHGAEYPVPNLVGESLEDAEGLVKNLRLRLEVSDSTYIITKRPGEILDQQPRAGEMVKKGRRIILSINALSPQLVVVPNLVGETIRQALIVLEQAGLAVGRLSFTPDIAINNVLAQNFNGLPIAPGDSIPKGSSLDLVLGNGFSGAVTAMPEILGFTLAEARNALAAVSMNVGRVTFDETVKDLSDSLTAKVYSTSPHYTGHDNLPLGARTDLWLTLNASRIAASAITRQDEPRPAEEARDTSPEEEEENEDLEFDQ